MKTIKLLALVLILTFAGTVQGQLSIRLNIGNPPAWGPAGYNDVRYYYLPDVEAYYDVQTSMFIYISGNRWIRRSYLPAHYKNYDLYHGYKVVMRDYRGNAPYSQFNEHRMKYAKGYRGEEQRNNGYRKVKYEERHQQVQPRREMERRDERNHQRDNMKNQKPENNKNNGQDNNGHENNGRK